MTRSLSSIAATLCLTTAVVAAQVPAGDKPASPSSQKTSATTGNKITYVGCIKPGASNGAWLLEHAEAQRAGGTGAGAVGTSGQSSMTLNLHPAATVNLKAHTNHKVEIVGMMSAPPSATATEGAKGGEAAAGVTGPTDAKGEAGTPLAANAKASESHFSVESLKMISGTCP